MLSMSAKRLAFTLNEKSHPSCKLKIWCEHKAGAYEVTATINKLNYLSRWNPCTSKTTLFGSRQWRLVWLPALKKRIRIASLLNLHCECCFAFFFTFSEQLCGYSEDNWWQLKFSLTSKLTVVNVLYKTVMLLELCMYDAVCSLCRCVLLMNCDKHIGATSRCRLILLSWLKKQATVPLSALHFCPLWYLCDCDFQTWLYQGLRMMLWFCICDWWTQLFQDVFTEKAVMVLNLFCHTASCSSLCTINVVVDCIAPHLLQLIENEEILLPVSQPTTDNTWVHPCLFTLFFFLVISEITAVETIDTVQLVEDFMKQSTQVLKVKSSAFSGASNCHI